MPRAPDWIVQVIGTSSTLVPHQAQAVRVERFSPMRPVSQQTKQWLSRPVRLTLR